MKEIILTKGRVAIVDDCDFDWLSQHKWCCSRYALRNAPYVNGVRKGMIYMHRAIMGEIPSGFQIDHKDGDRLNNQRSNLRLCKPVQNRQNSKRPVHNISGFKGASFDRRSKKWRAVIVVNNQQKHLGLFNSPESAHAAYSKAAIVHFKEFARLK